MSLVTHGLTAVSPDGLESWAYIFSTRNNSEAKPSVFAGVLMHPLAESLGLPLCGG